MGPSPLEDPARRRTEILRMTILTTTEIAALLGVPAPASEATLDRVASIAAAGPGAIVFATDPATFETALASTASLILAPQKLRADNPDPRVLFTKDPKFA